MIEILEAKSKKQQRLFIEFPNELYKGNPYFIPCLYMDEVKIFKKNYHYYDTCQAKYWLAYKDGKVVGRISAIKQNAANEKWNQKRIRFTRFDCVDDLEVAKALFEVVERYAKEENMNEVVGPLGFSDLEREGLLIEGFDYLNTFEEQYNYPYYQKLIESCGYDKDVDWIEHRLFFNEEKSKMLIQLSDRILEKNEVHLVPYMSTRKFVKKYGEQLFKLLDESYDKLYGTVPLTKEVTKMLISNFKLFINMDFLTTVVDNNDNIVAFSIAFPSIGKCLKDSNGHLTIKTIIKLLKELKKPTSLDLGLIGLLPEKSYLGGAALIFADACKKFEKYKFEYMETNLNLEDNFNIINAWRHFDHIQHKRRRCFIKSINYGE